MDVDHAESTRDPRIGRSVSLDHAAELLGVSRRTIYNRIRDGRLQTIRTAGGSQRVLLESVPRYLHPESALRVQAVSR
jgi:excisionase family DNA binding protein